MAFGIAGAVGPVAVELGVRFLQDLGPGLASPGAMGVNILALAELNVNRLRVLAPEIPGALVICGPFAADHDEAGPERHFRMGDFVILVEQHHVGLKPERLLKPEESGVGINIAQRAGKTLGPVKFGHRIFLSSDRNISSIVEIYSQARVA